VKVLLLRLGNPLDPQLLEGLDGSPGAGCGVRREGRRA
jgi:hypothetical protein